MAATKKNITVTVNKDELIYDIMNETFLRGRTIQNDENYKEVASMFASEDEENREKILRSIQKGFANIKVELAEYLDEGNTTPTSNIVDTDDDYEFSLSLPSNYNEAAASGLAENAHAYLANVAIGDWYLVTNKQDAEQYLQLAQGAMENLRKSMSKRTRPSKPQRTDADS